MHGRGKKCTDLTEVSACVCVHRGFGMWSGSSSVWCQNGLMNLSYLGEERKASQSSADWFSKVQQGVLMCDLMKPFNVPLLQKTWIKKFLFKVPYSLFLGILLSNAFSIPLILTANLTTAAKVDLSSWIWFLDVLLKSLKHWWDGSIACAAFSSPVVLHDCE